jgi:hypothetical protein
MSATVEGTWSRYRTALDELTATNLSDESLEDASEGVPETGSLPQHLRFKLNLERLAHAEFFRRDFQNGWRVVPPTIVVMPSNNNVRAVLCGARTDQLLSNLHRRLERDGFSVQPQTECPDRIILTTRSVRELSDLAQSENMILEEHGIEKLLTSIPPIDNYQLRSPCELPFGDDWKVERFSASQLKWVESSIADARGQDFGLFQVGVRFRPEYFLKLRGRSYKLPVQVGKYIVLGRAHRKVLNYDFDNSVLSMPVICRPPLLLDRALTLCTGLIPDIVDGHLEYRCIEPRHFASAKRILRQ